MLTPKRIYEEELLDLGAGSDDDVASNLADLRRVNRWLGGMRAIQEALKMQVSSNHQITSFLDVGTGSADIPSGVTSWCQKRGISATVTAVDISERNLRLARSRFSISSSVDLVQADSKQLPFSEKSFDYVTASMFLHHFQDEDVVSLLARFARLARQAIIVNDLVRNLIPYYFTRLAGPLMATSFLTRNDAPVSVLRGFTIDELRDLSVRAGLENVIVKRVFPYRLLLVARTKS